MQKSSHPSLSVLNPLDLQQQLLRRQAAGHTERLRMVGDGDVLVPLGTCGFPISNGVMAVAPRRVDVQVAPNVTDLDETRQAPFRATDISEPSSRSSGGMKGKSSAANTSASVSMGSIVSVASSRFHVR